MVFKSIAGGRPARGLEVVHVETGKHLEQVAAKHRGLRVALRLAFLKTCAVLFAVVFFSQLYLNRYSTLVPRTRGGTRCGRGRERSTGFPSRIAGVNRIRCAA